jgi:uncharacterized repeat protein (TIGR03803 family)
VEPTQHIRYNFTRLYRTAWFAVIVSALSALLPVQLQAGVSVTTLFTFDGTNGNSPDAPLIQGPNGSFYGTTEGGYQSSAEVFNLSQSGALKVVASSPGFDIWGPFVLTSDGSFYGTTSLGPSSSGSIFRVSKSGTVQVLFSFNGTNGNSPSGLIMGPDGALYGVTQGGGLGYVPNNSSGLGTIFRIKTNGVFSTILKFNGTNGSNPYRMILGRDGIFYGTTKSGGSSITNVSYGYGTIFKLSTNGSLTTLHSFKNTDGAGPLAIIQGAEGNLYGIAQEGGATATSPFGAYGTVYRMTTNGVFTKLGDCASATQFPLSIVEATDGTLYGSAIGATVGSIFRVDSGGTLPVVYSFDSSGLPGFLVQMPGGSIYGTTGSGGTYSHGTIFRLDVTADPPLLRWTSNQTNKLTLSWNATAGRNYQVQSCGDLFQQGWTNLGSAFMATNTTMSFSPVPDPIRGTFYRVVLLP